MGNEARRPIFIVDGVRREVTVEGDAVRIGPARGGGRLLSDRTVVIAIVALFAGAIAGAWLESAGLTALAWVLYGAAVLALLLLVVAGLFQLLGAAAGGVQLVARLFTREGRQAVASRVRHVKARVQEASTGFVVHGVVEVGPLDRRAGFVVRGAARSVRIRVLPWHQRELAALHTQLRGIR